MADERARIFHDLKPAIEEADIVKAARDHKVVVSFNAFPVLGEADCVTGLAVKLAFGDGGADTVIFDPMSGEMLRTVLELLKKARWQNIDPALSSPKSH
jgi:hypothetical protein